MENISTTTLVIIATAIITILGALATYAITKISTKATTAIKTKTENDNILGIVEFVKTTAMSIVNSLNQTIVDDLKAKSEDGKLTADDIDEIKERAKDTLTYVLQSDVIEKLETYVNDIDEFFDNIIEDSVRQFKTNFGTLIAAVNKTEDYFEGDPEEPEIDDDEDDIDDIGEELLVYNENGEIEVLETDEPIDDGYDDEEAPVEVAEEPVIEEEIEAPVEVAEEPVIEAKEPDSWPVPGVDEIEASVEVAENTTEVAQPKKKTSRKKKTE